MLEDSHDTVPSDLQGALLPPSPILAPGLGHEVCSPCRNDNWVVVQDAISALTELAPAPLLEQVDGVSGGDYMSGAHSRATSLRALI